MKKMNKQDLQQISFFTEEKKEDESKKKLILPYNATICYSCLCNMCINNVEYEREKITKEELQQQEPCWNCDECYFYGMDDPNLSQNIVKFECKNFKMLKYYEDLIARKERKKLKIVR